MRIILLIILPFLLQAQVSFEKRSVLQPNSTYKDYYVIYDTTYTGEVDGIKSYNVSTEIIAAGQFKNRLYNDLYGKYRRIGNYKALDDQTFIESRVLLDSINSLLDTTGQWHYINHITKRVASQFEGRIFLRYNVGNGVVRLLGQGIYNANNNVIVIRNDSGVVARIIPFADNYVRIVLLQEDGRPVFELSSSDGSLYTGKDSKLTGRFIMRK